MRLRQIFCLMAIAVTAGRSWAADTCNKGGLARSTVITDAGDAIDFALDHPVAYTDDDHSVQWLIYDENTKAAILIKEVHYDSPPHSSTGRITTNEPLNSTDTYVLSATGLRFENCSQPVQTNFVRINHSPAKKSGVSAFPLSAASSRDAADIYLGGFIDGAQHTHAAYTADIKTQLPVILPDSWPIVRGLKPLFTEAAFLPSFDFKASTNSKTNSNSIVIGSGVRLIAPLTSEKPGAPSRALFRDWLPYLGWALEADKPFSDVNNTFRFLNYFNLRTFGTRLQPVFKPMLGLELGSNARAAGTGLYNGAIARPAIGMHFYLNLFTSKDFKKTASIESDYVRRWPLNREPNSISDSSGKVVLTSPGTNPRDYVTTKLSYDFNSYFGLTLQHDYGELPPLFTKVQNKYSVGLVFKMGLQYKPK